MHTNNMDDFVQLLHRSGLPVKRIEAVFHRPYDADFILHFCKDAVKECCFLNRIEVLRDLVSFFQRHASWGQVVKIVGDDEYFDGNFSINIVMRLTKQLFRKGILALLPSFVQTIIDVSYVDIYSLERFMRQVRPLHSEDDQLVTAGYEALFETARILLNNGMKPNAQREKPNARREKSNVQRKESNAQRRESNDERVEELSGALFYYILRCDEWSTTPESSVASIEKHYQMVVRLIPLFLKYPIWCQPAHTHSIVAAAKKHVKLFKKTMEKTMRGASEDNADQVHLAKTNAALDGLGEMLRCFMLASRSYAHATTIYADKYWAKDEPLFFIEKSTVRIIEYSSKEGRSSNLIRLLLDAMTCSDEIDIFKSGLLDQRCEDMPVCIKNNLHSSRKTAIEYVNELSCSLQHLARRAIHQALWDRDLPIQRASLSTLGLPDIMLNYCLYN